MLVASGHLVQFSSDKTLVAFVFIFVDHIGGFCLFVLCLCLVLLLVRPPPTGVVSISGRKHSWSVFVLFG